MGIRQRKSIVAGILQYIVESIAPKVVQSKVATANHDEACNVCHGCSDGLDRCQTC